VCRAYAEVNDLFGDIVKVTPTSKAVGDMALFLVANNLSATDLLKGDREFAFPESVIDLIGGRMGQPPGGFPPAVVALVMRGKPVMEARPGESLPPANFEKAAEEIREFLQRAPNRREVLSYLLYPKVYREFVTHQQRYSDTSDLPTPVFFYGQLPGEEFSLDIEPGKTLIVKFTNVGEPHSDGRRSVFFELNGQPRDVTVVDRNLEPETKSNPKADLADPKQVGAAMPGMVVTVAVQPGDQVAKGQKLLTLEAMKMEATIYAERDGKIGQVLVKAGTPVQTGDLLVAFE
jgi:pyruvate carboxylase